MNKTEKERIAVVETKITALLDSLKEHSAEQRADFDRVFVKLDNLKDSFAGKWTEKVVLGLVLTIITGFITFLFTLA